MSERTKNGRGRASTNSRSSSRNRRGSRDHGKAMAKQKNKNKLKRDLNRKGAEKEGTDMDAFVNSAGQPTAKPDGKQQENTATSNFTLEHDTQEVSPKEKETSEMKPDAEPDVKSHKNSNELLTNETSGDFEPVLIDKVATSTKNDKESKELTSANEDSNKCAHADHKTDDVVDHANTNNTLDVEAIVAQKNEENAKVSADLINRTLEVNTQFDSAPGIDKEDETEVSGDTETSKAITGPPSLKYTYPPHQWSPQNTSGKKEYDREFLMKLQDDPQSRVRPPNLPDMDVVLKDCTRQPNRGQVDMRMFKESRAHETLFPGFAKPSFNSKLPPITKKNSYQGSKPKPINKQAVIHVSLTDEVKLKTTENAWKPARLKSDTTSEEDVVTDTLYKKVRSVLNKLTPQKFDTLVNQVRALDIDTMSRLQGVIDLVFEKAIDEPSFSVAYALMCKELGELQISDQEKDRNFRTLLLTRCQSLFEKNTATYELVREVKLKEIEECTNADKKKELQLLLEEEDRQIRMKSVGNIRFIGELYKQQVITSKIMHTCIVHLLKNNDEENLECLCKLLTTIGKIFEKKAIPESVPKIQQYFVTLSDMVNKKGSKKISSRVRFMIQDVIDLRQNKWIPRRDDSNPKTMAQIQREAETERLDTQLTNTPINTPRRDDMRTNDRRRNRGGGPNNDDGGWSAPVGSSKTRQPYSVETSKLNTKPPPMDQVKLGNRNQFVWNPVAPAGKPTVNALTPNKFAVLSSLEPEKRPLPLSGSRSTGPQEYRSNYNKYPWDGRGSRNNSHQMSSSNMSSVQGPSMEYSRSQSITMPPPSIMFKTATPSGLTASSNVSSKPPKTEDQLISIVKANLDDRTSMTNTESFITFALESIQENFDHSTYPLLVREGINAILERSVIVRQRFSALLAHMINHKMIPLSLIQTEYEKIIEFVDDLVIDIPKCWTYFGEILSELIALGAHPLVELKKTVAILKRSGSSLKLLGEVFSKLSKDPGPQWLVEKWQQSGLEWSDLADLERENLDEMIKKYNLKFLIEGCSSVKPSAAHSNLTQEQIQEHLVKLMKTSDFDSITGWITVNVGEREKQPQFIRALVTAICKVSIEWHETSPPAWKLNIDKFNSLSALITRYVDTAAPLELQCLFAVQGYLCKLDFPQGVLGNVIEALCDNASISDDAFLSWQDCTDPAEMDGHAVAVRTLTSFFVRLRETHDDSSDGA